MPRSTALTHFSTARSLEPYRTAFRLLTTQVEGIPPMQARSSTAAGLRDLMGPMRGRFAWVEPRRRARDLIKHICTRIGVSSRAAAALFAMGHHLLANKDG
jgi:hypothetical protein